MDRHDLVKLLERAQKERRDATSASDASASGAKDSKEESGATGEIEDPTSSASATGAIGANDEKNLGRKPKNDYEPFVYEMIPTKKAKELRMDLNMLTIARRPFKLILNETIERAKEDKNEDTLESCDRKRKFDLAQFYPELKIEYPRESELIKNVVRSKRQRSSRHIG